MMLRNGGTLYIDPQAAPGLVETQRAQPEGKSPRRSTSTCREASTCCCLPGEGRGLRASFFRISAGWLYAGAALPQNLWERMQALRQPSGRTASARLRLGLDRDRALANLRSTTRSTAPASSAAGPPGCELKLVPAAGKLEVRVKGPNCDAGLLRPRRLTRAGVRREATTASATR